MNITKKLRIFLSLTSLASPTLELADLSAAANKDKINHQFDQVCRLG